MRQDLICEQDLELVVLLPQASPIMFGSEHSLCSLLFSQRTQPILGLLDHKNGLYWNLTYMYTKTQWSLPSQDLEDGSSKIKTSKLSQVE